MKPLRAVLAAATLPLACLDESGVVLRGLSDAGFDASALDAPAGPATLRFVNLASDRRQVNLCLAPTGDSFGAPAIGALGGVALSAPLSLAPGLYDFRVTSAASSTCLQTISEAFERTLNGGAYTLVFLGDPTAADGGTPTHPFSLVLLADDAPGAGAILRAFNAATDAPSVSLEDLADGATTELASMAYGSTPTQNASPNGYVALAPGLHDLLLNTGTGTAAIGTLDAASGSAFSVFAVNGSQALVCDDVAIDAGASSCTIH